MVVQLDYIIESLWVFDMKIIVEDQFSNQELYCEDILSIIPNGADKILIEQLLDNNPECFFLCENNTNYWFFKEYLMARGKSKARIINLDEYKEYKNLEIALSNKSGVQRIEMLYKILQNIIERNSFDNMVIEDCKLAFENYLKKMRDIDYWG